MTGLCESIGQPRPVVWIVWMLADGDHPKYKRWCSIHRWELEAVEYAEMLAEMDPGFSYGVESEWVK